MNIFYSQKIKTKLWNDEFITMESLETEEETNFTYDLPLDFVDAQIKSPIPYLFDKLIRVAKKELNLEDIEKGSTMSFLAINSKT